MSESIQASDSTTTNISRPNPFRPEGFFGNVFDFLGSLKVCVFLLTILGLLCVAGTLYESSATARYAQRVIYRSAWFDALLVSIVINVIFSTLSRYPWRLHQLGFVTTHLGVLIILAGAFVSHRWGAEGTLMLNEGSSGDSIELDQSYVSIQKSGENFRHKFDSSEIEWGKPEVKPQQYIISDLGVKLLAKRFLPDSQRVEKWTNDNPSYNPAIHFAIVSSFAGQMVEGWLAPRSVSHRSQNLGPATITSREVASPEDLSQELNPPPLIEDASPEWIEITFKQGGKKITYTPEKLLNQTIPLEGTEYSLRVTSVMPFAYLDDSGNLRNSPDREPNPLIIFDILKDDQLLYEQEMRFALFPDFHNVHGADAPDLPFDISYKVRASTSPKSSEFVLLLGPEEQLHWKVTTSSGQVSSGPIILGVSVPMPMMTTGMNLLVDQFYPNARLQQELEPVPVKPGDFRQRAIQFSLIDLKSGKQVDFWQEYYQEQEVLLDGNRYIVSYQPVVLPLGFTIQLKDFRLKTYPGSQGRPMSYESDVQVIDQSGSSILTRNETIMMNKPLDHRGFRVFQSSYIDQPRGDPQISIFSIARAPGVLTIYIGSTILCIGIALIFYGKSWLMQLEKRWQNRHPKKQNV